MHFILKPKEGEKNKLKRKQINMFDGSITSPIESLMLLNGIRIQMKIHTKSPILFNRNTIRLFHCQLDRIRFIHG